MSAETQEILTVLAAYGIAPEDRDGKENLPEVGELQDGEWIHQTSIAEIDADWPESPEGFPYGLRDERVREWWQAIQQIIKDGQDPNRRVPPEAGEDSSAYGPWSPAAWYCPIHFFGEAWGIYIRESALFSISTDIARQVNWSQVKVNKSKMAQQLLRAAFYVLFLHEQFHHKVESLGLRMMVAASKQFYIPYSRGVYQATFRTDDCLEESLANAESYRRFKESTYKNIFDTAIHGGLLEYLLTSFKGAPPGYRRAPDFLSEKKFRDGLWRLQSQVKEGVLLPSWPSSQWAVAGNMTKALKPISSEIFLIVPTGHKPIVSKKDIRPGFTATTAALQGALIRHYGFREVSGGKGSHIKLQHADATTVVLTNRCNGMSREVITQAIKKIGPNYGLNRLPELLKGTLLRV